MDALLYGNAAPRNLKWLWLPWEITADLPPDKKISLYSDYTTSSTRDNSDNSRCHVLPFQSSHHLHRLQMDLPHYYSPSAEEVRSVDRNSREVAYATPCFLILPELIWFSHGPDYVADGTPAFLNRKTQPSSHCSDYVQMKRQSPSADRRNDPDIY